MKNLIILIFLLSSCYGLAQTVTISEGISLRTDDEYDFIGKLKNQYLVFHNKGTEFEIKAFDKNLKSAWDKEIELEKRRTNVLGIIATREDFSVIYTCRVKRKLHIMLSRFSPAANLMDTTVIKKYDSQILTPSFQVIRSEDKKTVLIYEIEEQKKMKAIAFNLETRKVLWERMILPEDMLYYEKYEQVLITNHGELFLILKKDNKKARKDKHLFQIHLVTADNSYSFFDIHMKGKLTYDVLFSYDNKNELLIAAGLYSEKNRSRANGYYFLSIPPDDHKNYQVVFEAFDEKTLKNIMGKKADVKKGLTDLDVQEVVHRHDGGALLIIERNRHLERGGTNNGPAVGYTGGRSFVDYYYDDVLVVSLHPDGKLHWKNVLHKKQFSQDDKAKFSSYFLLKTPSSLRFIYNDEVKIENTVSEYVVNGSGEMRRNSILNTDNKKIQLRFVEGLQVGSNELIVPSIMRSKMKLIRLFFDK